MIANWLISKPKLSLEYNGIDLTMLCMSGENVYFETKKLHSQLHEKKRRNDNFVNYFNLPVCGVHISITKNEWGGKRHFAFFLL